MAFPGFSMAVWDRCTLVRAFQSLHSDQKERNKWLATKARRRVADGEKSDRKGTVCVKLWTAAAAFTCAALGAGEESSSLCSGGARKIWEVLGSWGFGWGRIKEA